jgi:hypothetical protein
MTLAASLGVLVLQAVTTKTGDLAAPVRVQAGETVIDVEVGHAAPLVLDWDGDGLEDLLVGQFGDGKLLIYKNRGSRGRPSFSEHIVFQAASTDGVIPAG